MRALCGVLLLWAAAEAAHGDVRAGGAGHALLFAPHVDGEVRTTPISPDEELSALSVTFWARRQPVADPDAAASDALGYTGAYFSIVSDSADATAVLAAASYDDLIVSVFDQPVYVTGQPADESEWFHVAATVSPGGRVVVCVNGTAGCVSYEYDEAVEMQAVPVDSYVRLGRGAPADQPLNGQLDEFCIWTVPLSLADVGRVFSEGCDAALLAPIVHLSFDEDRTDHSTLQVWDSAVDGFTGLMRDSLDDVALDFGDADFPYHVPSQAPVIGDAGELIAVLPAAAGNVTVALACVECDEMELLIVPDAGVLLDAATGGELAPGDALAPNAAVTFVAVNESALPAALSFEARNTSTGAAADGSVTFVLNTAPSAAAEAFDMDTDDAMVVSVLTSACTDPEGDQLWVVVDALAAGVKLYQVVDNEGTAGEEIEEVPALVSHELGWVLAVKNDSSTTQSVLSFHVTDGYLASESASITIDMSAANSEPTPAGAELATDEDTALAFNLEASDEDGDDLYVYLTRAPDHGQLFQTTGGGDVSVSVSVLCAAVEYWAASGNVSSAWYSSAAPDGYTAAALVGAPDVFPDHGRLPGAWEPASGADVSAQWFEVETADALYLTSVEVYETWHPGAIVAVSVQNPAGDWVVVWEGDSTQAELNPDPSVTKSLMWSQKTCPKPWSVSRVRFDLQLASAEYWYACDAVRLLGTSSVDTSVIRRSDLALSFVPDTHFFGADSFDFAVNDCPSFISTMDLFEDQRTATINITVVPTNDPPAPVDNATALLDTDALACALLSGVDVDSDQADLSFVVERAGTHGTTYDVLPDGSRGDALARGEQPDGGFALSSNQVCYAPDECETIDDFVGFVVFDGDLYSTDEGRVDFQVECADKIYLTPVELQAATGVLASLALVLIVVTAVVLRLHSEKLVIKAASPLWTNVILLFNALGVMSGILYVIDPGRENDVCVMRPIVSGLSVVGSMGALIVKTERIDRIFNNKRNTVNVRVSNHDLMRTFLALLGVEVFILFLYLAFYAADYEIVDGESTVVGYKVKQCEDVVTFSTLQLIYVLSLFGYGLRQSWRVRNTPSAFNEAVHIASAVFLYVIVLTVSVPAVVLTGADPNANAVARGIGAEVLMIGVTLALFAPKLYFLWQGKGDDRLLAGEQASSVGRPSSGAFTERDSAPDSRSAGAPARATEMSPIETKNPVMGWHGPSVRPKPTRVEGSNPGVAAVSSAANDFDWSDANDDE